MSRETKSTKNEIAWVQYNDSEGNMVYLMTSSPLRDIYYLYKYDGRELKRIGKSKNPVELEQRFKVMQNLVV